jgi:lysophospholipase L1-like esterase
MYQIATVLAGSLLLVGVHGPAEVHYVALGDSYAAGVGAGGYDATSRGCERSVNAYPELWAKAHDVASYSSQACTGASTVDVIETQLDALSAATTLVTITVGGNDIGFTEVLTGCVLGGDSTCANKVAGAEAAMRNQLPAALDRTFQTISQRAPSAKVVVVGYPKLFEPGPCPGGFSQAKRDVLNRGADTLAATIADRAAVAHVTFADARPAFAGHGVCSADSWIHGLLFPCDGSYHPTATGHSRGYLPLLNSVTR